MTYVTDPIGDFLTRMRNAQMARQKSCTLPWSRMKEELAQLLKKGEWLEDVSVTGEGHKREITVTFMPGKRLMLTRISKPGRRVYTKAQDILPVLRGYGQAVISTSEGLVTDEEARKKNIGGEILCTVS